MYVGESWSLLGAQEPAKYTLGVIHAGAREPTVRSQGSPCASRGPAPPGSPACSSPPTPERPPAPQTRAGEPRWGLRTSLGCSPPLRLAKEILRLWASGGRGGCPATARERGEVL